MSGETNHDDPVEFEWTRKRHDIRQAAKRFLEGDETMTHQPADGERSLPEDIADLVCCWVIDYLEDGELERLKTGPCLDGMKQRMAPYLAYQAAAAEQLRAVMEANEKLQAENKRMMAELSTRTQQRDDQDQLRGEFAKRCVEAEVESDRLKEVLSDDFGFGSTASRQELQSGIDAEHYRSAAGWLPREGE